MEHCDHDWYFQFSNSCGSHHGCKSRIPGHSINSLPLYAYWRQLYAKSNNEAILPKRMKALGLLCSIRPVKNDSYLTNPKSTNNPSHQRAMGWNDMKCTRSFHRLKPLSRELGSDWVGDRASECAHWSAREKRTMQSEQCGASSAEPAVWTEQCRASSVKQAVRSRQMSEWCEQTSKLPSTISFLPIAQRRLLIGLLRLTTNSTLSLWNWTWKCTWTSWKLDRKINEIKEWAK